jgi:hypothetical protein
MKPNEDPEIFWIREVRMRISEEFNHDPELLLKHYMELQQHHKDRLVQAAVPKGADGAAEALVGKTEP